MTELRNAWANDAARAILHRVCEPDQWEGDVAIEAFAGLQADLFGSALPNDALRLLAETFSARGTQ